jgi:hypothetical protein
MYPIAAVFRRVLFLARQISISPFFFVRQYLASCAAAEPLCAKLFRIGTYENITKQTTLTGLIDLTQ